MDRLDESRPRAAQRRITQTQPDRRLNSIENTDRRNTLWNSALAIQPAGPLFETADPQPTTHNLQPMTPSERLNADFRGTHLTIGRHPMSFHRDRLNQLGVVPANRVSSVPNGRFTRIAGCVICRQRPGTAKGLVIMPDVFDRERTNVLENAYVMVEGEMQNIRGVTSVKAARVVPLHVAEEAVPSHDFH
jgi:error-prone DNA polymerase